ncbi:hypothetical protein, partial [Nocardia vulneris]
HLNLLELVRHLVRELATASIHAESIPADPREVDEDRIRQLFARTSLAQLQEAGIIEALMSLAR